MWASVGFVEVDKRRSVMALNPNLNSAYEGRATLRERFGLETVR